jgi:hypothetical protein
MEVLDRALSLGNLSTNIEKLHTPTSTPKKTKRKIVGIGRRN